MSHAANLNLSSDQANWKSSQSKERKVQLLPSDDETTFAKVDHLARQREWKQAAAVIPKEILEL